jgi:hypothetical protein
MLTLIGAFCFAPTGASAHGGPPAALGLLAANGTDPEVILLNEGLALKQPEAWTYICPSLWGEVNQASGKFPLARSADGIDTWVVGDDLYLLRDQQLTRQMRPDYARSNMIALANDAEHVYGLHYSGVGMATEVVRMRAEVEAPLWTSTEYWSAITANEAGIHLARIAGEKQLELITLDSAGQEKNRALATLPLNPYEIQLHALGQRVYVTATDGPLALIGYFEGTAWKEVTQQTPPLVGPQTSPDGTLWVAVGGILNKLSNDVLERTGETRIITCLERWNDWYYVCAGSDLHRLTESGVGEQLFLMDGFHPPDPKLVPPEQEANCEQQWVLYTVDATRVGLTFAAWPKGPASGPMSGAATAGASSQAAAGASASGAAGTAAAAGAGPAAMATAAPTEGGCSAVAVRAVQRSAMAWLASVAAVFVLRRARKRTL